MDAASRVRAASVKTGRGLAGLDRQRRLVAERGEHVLELDAGRGGQRVLDARQHRGAAGALGQRRQRVEAGQREEAGRVARHAVGERGLERGGARAAGGAQHAGGRAQALLLGGDLRVHALQARAQQQAAGDAGEPGGAVEQAAQAGAWSRTARGWRRPRGSSAARR